MTIDEAIRVKEEEIAKPLSHSFAAINKADRLSIEALKRIQEWRRRGIRPKPNILPGETKDEVTSQDIKHRLSWALDSGETKD